MIHDHDDADPGDADPGDAGAAAAAASAAIDQLLVGLDGSNASPAGRPLPGSVHVHCTDTAGEWTLRQGEHGWAVGREHAKGDCALRGPAVVLLAVLRREAPVDAADVVGDAAVAAAFVGLLPG
jgi:hypothetical protein